MLFDEPIRQINVPRSLVVSGPAVKAAGAARQRREFARRIGAFAALRRAGEVIGPTFTDDEGQRLPEEEDRALRDEVEAAIRELAGGRAAHAARTIAELEASRKSDVEQVDDLLKGAYQALAQGVRSRDVLDRFLDTFERWLTRDGVARVNLLFDRVDLGRAPESLGILLLATTRLTRENFVRRKAFVQLLSSWLIGRSGRTEEDVDSMLRGLRE